MASKQDKHISFGKSHIRKFMGRKHKIFFDHPKSLEDYNLHILNQLNKFI